MLTHDEMIGLQSTKHDLIDVDNFNDENTFILHLMHTFAYHKIADLVKDKSVLDLGCNTGYGSKILAKTARHVVGVDVSANAIAIAMSKHKTNNIEYELIDGRRLPFPDKCFDIIIICQVIEHIVDYDIFIREITRVLIPHGIVIFTTPNATLRLDPGMKPWNPFHVTEFDQNTLPIILRKYFRHISLLGLFAEKNLYLMEKKRISLAKDAAKRSKIIFLRSIRWIYRSIITLFTQSSRSTNKANIHSSSESPSRLFASKHSLGDLFYSPLRLGDALDLMAICSNTAHGMNDAKRQIESDERQRGYHPMDWL